MKFDLTAPCSNCPFRTDITPYLKPARVREIDFALTRMQGTFSCHKTNDTVEDEEGYTESVETDRSQHCAGALIYMEKQGYSNQMMRIAERLGFYDVSKLDMEAPVYDDLVEMLKAHRRPRTITDLALEEVRRGLSKKKRKKVKR